MISDRPTRGAVFGPRPKKNESELTEAEPRNANFSRVKEWYFRPRHFAKYNKCISNLNSYKIPYNYNAS